MLPPDVQAKLWRKRQVAKLAYLESELELANAAINDVTLRQHIVADLHTAIQHTAKELADGFNLAHVAFVHVSTPKVDFEAELRKRGLPLKRGLNKGEGSPGLADNSGETGC